MHVHGLRRVHTGRGPGQLGDVETELRVQLLERPEVAEVEHGTEVDVEAFAALAGEHATAARQRLDGRVRETDVVRRRQRPDVARRARHPIEELRAATGADVVQRRVVVSDPIDARHGIELLAVPARAVQRGDRADVVEERAADADLGLEPELVRDVGVAVAVVVDVDLVQHVITELVEVRAAGRTLQRHVVGNQRDRVGCVGTDERVQVGAVGDRVLRDLGRLAVRRHDLTSLVCASARCVIDRRARQRVAW